MNLSKRIEAIEAVATLAERDKAVLIILRSLVAAGMTEEPMNFITYEGQEFERGSEETEDAFVDRVKHEIVAKYGPGKAHLVIGSTERGEFG